MAKKRKSHSATFKAQVALAAVKGDKTVSELASLHSVHPTMIHTWKKQLVENAEELFQTGAKASGAEHEALQAQLYEQIGRLKTELDWLKKKLPASVERKRAWVDSADAVLSVSAQCELLGLSRSSYYYEPATESAENLALMALIDKEYTDHPFRGSRGMKSWLRQNGHKVNRKRVQRLMRLMGLEAVYPKPRLSVGGAGHKVYPYLLRGVEIERADQVWSTDITYIPMPNGFMYLTAVIDWYSRCVLSWKLSNTLDVGFCLEALEEALGRGCPEVFNTDQGVQFTSASFTSRVEAAGAKVSMDGRGPGVDLHNDDELDLVAGLPMRIRKPNRRDWIALFPAMELSTCLLPHKSQPDAIETEYYFVDKRLRGPISDELKQVRVLPYYSFVAKAYALWIVHITPGNTWYESIARLLSQPAGFFEQNVIRVMSDKLAGRYRVLFKMMPSQITGPTTPTEELVGNSLGADHFINATTHPIYRDLIEGTDL